MANRAYLRVWTRDFAETTMIAEFARFLTSAPLSASENTFTELIVQAVDVTETPTAEWDLRDQGYGPAEVAALAAQHLNADTAYFASAKWDLWGLDVNALSWRHERTTTALRQPPGTWPRTWGSSIFSPGTEGCWHPVRRRIHLLLQTIQWSILSAGGWRREAT
jgi:hypothetical protein